MCVHISVLCDYHIDCNRGEDEDCCKPFSPLSMERLDCLIMCTRVIL